MRRVNCLVPLVVRLRGLPDDERLDETGEAIGRTVAGRLAEANRVIAAREGWDSWRKSYAAPEIRFSGASLDDDLRRRVAAAIEAGITRALRGGPAIASQALPFVLAQYHPSAKKAVEARSIPIHGLGPPWFIRRAVNFQANVGSFLQVVNSWNEVPSVELYLEFSDETRWVSVWLVQVNREFSFSEIFANLERKAKELNRVRPNQVLFVVGGIHESLREKLIAIDDSQVVAREMPRMGDAGKTRRKGKDVRLLPGAKMLFASMVLPEIVLKDRADLGSELQAAVRLRDLTFLVNPVATFDRFERHFSLSWEAYLREFGDRPATLRIQPATVRQRTYFLTLKTLVERAVLQRIDSELAPLDAHLYGDLYLLNDATLERWPAVVRGRANSVTDDVTRMLDKPKAFGNFEQNWKAAYVYSVLTISPKSIHIARYRPSARGDADRLIPLISERLVTWKERWDFIDFAKYHLYGFFPPMFEVLLDELKRRDGGKWFGRFFEAIKEAENYELRLSVIRSIQETKYASDPSVLDLVKYHNKVERQHPTGNVYNVADQKIILNKFFGDQTVFANDILYEVWDSYIHEEKRYRPKSSRVKEWEAALLSEALELIGRIDKGEDPRGNDTGYTEEEFAETVLKAVFSRIGITEDNVSDYFDTITVQLSVRFLGLAKSPDEYGIESVTVLYRVVQREKGGSWKDIDGDLRASAADFEWKIDQWVHARVSSAIITIAHISLAIAAVGVAWQFGVLAPLMRLGGGARVVIPSIILSTIFEVIINGFTFESFLFGAINGFLGALFFRGAGGLARGLFGRSITTISWRDGLLIWIDIQVFKGTIGGGATGAAIRFSHDVYMVATGRGGWSSPEEYARSISYGVAFGIGFEFAGPLLLQPIGARIFGSARDVVKLLLGDKVTAARFQAWSVQAYSGISRRLAALLESQPGKATTIRNGIKLLYEQVGEAYAGLGRGISGRVQLSVFRQLLEFSGEALSGQATKGLEKFLRGSAEHLTEDAALNVVKRITGGRAKDFFEVLNLLDDTAINRLIGSGEFEGWLIVFERNIELSPNVLAGLDRLYGSALDRNALSDLLRLAPKDNLPDLLPFLGSLEQGIANDLMMQGYFLPLSRAPRVVQFVTQAENLDRLHRIVRSASGGESTHFTVDAVVSSLESLIQKNPSLKAPEIEAAAIKIRSPVLSGGGATWPGSTGKTSFWVREDGSVSVTLLERGDLPRTSGGPMLASALRAAGARKPPEILLLDVVHPETLEALRQKQEFANTTLGKTFTATAKELGGKIVDTRVITYRAGEGRRERRLRYDVLLRLEY